MFWVRLVTVETEAFSSRSVGVSFRNICYHGRQVCMQAWSLDLCELKLQPPSHHRAVLDHSQHQCMCMCLTPVIMYVHANIYIYIYYPIVQCHIIRDPFISMSFRLSRPCYYNFKVTVLSKHNSPLRSHASHSPAPTVAVPRQASAPQGRLGARRTGATRR